MGSQGTYKYEYMFVSNYCCIQNNCTFAYLHEVLNKVVWICVTIEYERVLFIGAENDVFRDYIYHIL